MSKPAGMYTKGTPLCWDKDWYHGELSRVGAEQALTASGCDCFLVRVSEGALILSLIHHGQLHHINIKYGPGWYELETGQAQYSFTDLEELVNHYSSSYLSELMMITLGQACGKKKSAEHHYETVAEIIYAKGEPEDLIKHSWYHGNITEEQAEAALCVSKNNGYLVRVSAKNLVLSMRINGWISHEFIRYSPRGYQLEGREKIFQSIPEMISHYHNYSIGSRSQVLGTAISSVPASDQVLMSAPSPRNIFTKKENILSLNWKKCEDLPVSTASPHVVKIGDCVYVGGGIKRTKENRLNLIYKFTMYKNTWTTLIPLCPTYHHALVSINDKLIAIGGEVAINKVSNLVYTLQNGEWIKVLPSMPTPRCLLSALSHNDKFIIAAGGMTQFKSNGEPIDTDRVEVYSCDSGVWYMANSLPFPMCSFSMCKIGDICYILGGTGKEDQASTVLYTSIASLLESLGSLGKQETQWKQMKHPLRYSFPVELDGRLITLGGSSDPRQRCASKFISTYDFASDTWVECKGAELPVPLYRAGVVKLDSDQVMIVGGQTKMQQLCKDVYIGSYKTLKKLETFDV